MPENGRIGSVGGPFRTQDAFRVILTLESPKPNSFEIVFFRIGKTRLAKLRVGQLPDVPGHSSCLRVFVADFLLQVRELTRCA